MTEEEHKLVEIQLVKQKCLDSLLFFTQYFFKELNGSKFLVNHHHITMCDYLERVHRGEILRLIINISPRFSKTELSVINFIAWSLAKRASCEFIHASYSDELALDNAEGVKDIILLDTYQKMFPEVQLKKDATGKKKWKTTKGGIMFSTNAGGTMTGFGAGKLNHDGTFGGCFIYDDPIKPEDANNKLSRDKVNKRYISTVKSRLNHRLTPMIITMQRLHEYDLCGYVLDKEPNTWTVLSLPAIKDGVPLWEYKLNVEDCENLKKIDANIYQTQYLQEPISQDGNFLKRKDFIVSDRLPFNPNEVLKEVYIDGAYSMSSEHDPSAVMIVYYFKGDLYILKSISVMLEQYEFINWFQGFAQENNIYKNNRIMIEPRSSGQGFMSMLSKQEYGGFSCQLIKGAVVQKSKDERVANISGVIQSGRVILLKGSWNDHFINQCISFPRGRNDDELDLLCYAIYKYFVNRRTEESISYE